MTSNDIKILRVKLGNITQAQLAEKLGVTVKTINTLEAGAKIPLKYQWAIKGIELQFNLDNKDK